MDGIAIPLHLTAALVSVALTLFRPSPVEQDTPYFGESDIA